MGSGEKDPDKKHAAAGTDAVALLHDLFRFREALARSIARNNLELGSDQITAAVNRILFPLLLVRIAEDRSLVPGGTLADLRNCRDTSRLISALSGYADALYKEDLPVSPRPTDPGNDLVVESAAVLLTLDGLTSPDRRYDFEDMSMLVVSGVLMQYLSRTIRRSAVHQAVVVDTHDTVLSGGTIVPAEPLVRYLVRQALTHTRVNRSAHAPLPIRICDPACGSGAVLLAAYHTFLENAGGAVLTFDERREILVHSVHGLDISRHAVAATRMLLFFELCNGPGAGRPGGDFPSLVVSVIRDLRHTILCGNALIGPEIVSDEAWMFCPARDRHNLKPFSFRERFPEIHAGGGFDAMVCNPPEGALEKREWIQQYFQRHYRVYHPNADRSAYFVEKSLSLIAPGGTISCIMSSRWLRGSAGSALRELVASRQIEEIVDQVSGYADGSGADLCLLHVRNIPPSRPFYAIPAGARFMEDPGMRARELRFPVDQQVLDHGGWTLNDTRAEDILRKVFRHSTPFDEVVMGQVHPGIPFPVGDPFLIEGDLARGWLRRDPRCKPLLRPVLSCRDSGYNDTRACGNYVLFIPRGWTRSHPGAKKPWQWLKHRYPLIARHLQNFSAILKERSGSDDQWWEMAVDEFWQEPRKKLLCLARFAQPVFHFDAGHAMADETMIAIPSSGMYLAGVLNSRLMRFVFDQGVRQAAPGRKFFTCDDLCGLPVITPDFDKPEDLDRHNRIESLVRKRITLEKNRRAVPDGPERESLQKQIRKMDRQIDADVYGLYDLTLEEIAVVEARSL